jgi:hypothetical protein
MMMQYYTLDTKLQDAAFLAGQPVTCPIALSQQDLAAGNLREGAAIVIMLSNRAKYKARVLTLTYTLKGTHATGEMTITREVTT